MWASSPHTASNNARDISCAQTSVRAGRGARAALFRRRAPAPLAAAVSVVRCLLMSHFARAHTLSFETTAFNTLIAIVPLCIAFRASLRVVVVDDDDVVVVIAGG